MTLHLSEIANAQAERVGVRRGLPWSHLRATRSTVTPRVEATPCIRSAGVGKHHAGIDTGTHLFVDGWFDFDVLIVHLLFRHAELSSQLLIKLLAHRHQLLLVSTSAPISFQGEQRLPGQRVASFGPACEIALDLRSSTRREVLQCWEDAGTTRSR